MAKLLFITPEFAGECCALAEGKTTVGRAPGHALIIEHGSVSADHCEILVHGREVIVRECGSSNGTWVDGCRVQGQRAVRHGETIRFGSIEARVDLPPDYEEEPQTTMTAIHLHARAVKEPLHALGPASPTIIKPQVPEVLPEQTVSVLSERSPSVNGELPSFSAAEPSRRGALILWLLAGAVLMALVVYVIWRWWGQ